MGKSPEAFRTISEVSDELDVPKHVLRFWETKFAQVKPMKRGGNRRYYRPEDVELLRGIRTLLHYEGYTIRGVQRVFRQQGVSFVKRHARAAGSRDPAQSPSAFPDLAGETAGHARKEAAERAKAGPKPASRAADAPKNAATDPLTRAQRQTLEAALRDLEQCQQLLAGAEPETPAG